MVHFTLKNQQTIYIKLGKRSLHFFLLMFRFVYYASPGNELMRKRPTAEQQQRIPTPNGIMFAQCLKPKRYQTESETISFIL